MLVAIIPELLLPSGQLAQSGLPDFTQPQSLNQIASHLPISIAIFAILAIGLSVGMALFNFSLRNYPQQRNVVIGDWMMRSTQLMKVLQQTLLISIILLAGFGFCSTLASRQSSWEQAKTAQTTPTIAGELVRQSSPQVSYTSQEPYVYTTELEGKLVKVQDKKDVTRQSSVSGSNLQLSIAPTSNKSGDSQNYLIDFKGDYQITNPIGTTDRFVFQIDPPTGYSLLQNFGVEQNGKRLATTNPGEYRFPLQIAPGSVSKLRVSYRAQGSPQWVYSAKDGSLANFWMSIDSKVPRLNFVSGIAPTKVTSTGDRQIFTWAFNQNASVQKPFGVAVSAPIAAQTGTLPLLLLLAPGIFLWWILLLCLSMPMRLEDIAIAGCAFFAGMFALTYVSRIADPLNVWSGISICLLLLVWGLGRNNWRISLAAIICTILGVILPVYGFSIGARGVMLSIAALLSVTWLAVRNWYNWYHLAPTDSGVDRPIYEDPEGVFTRQDLLEESAQYNQINPATPSTDDITQRLQDKT
ncbi:hypothetical protein [Chamaesiphon sp. VAR_48_metabat_135_sub]|uniref:hypothetical protein n=1 Tax=Chamaesiphon sp. VAR_48_metabat_135_sub TaxID=2964699 RepID=UPI00286A7C8E|nr:hypothetical protein [Chamaesiphon sp. VAR_48_metabat_135_sub]